MNPATFTAHRRVEAMAATMLDEWDVRVAPEPDRPRVNRADFKAAIAGAIGHGGLSGGGIVAYEGNARSNAVRFAVVADLLDSGRGGWSGCPQVNLRDIATGEVDATYWAVAHGVLCPRCVGPIIHSAVGALGRPDRCDLCDVRCQPDDLGVNVIPITATARLMFNLGPCCRPLFHYGEPTGPPL